MKRALALRTAAGLTIAVVAAFAIAHLAAQQPVPGRNVNVNGGPTWINLNPFEIVGDPWRSQAVEPDCDVSSRNPAVIVCASVGYQMVDVPGGLLNLVEPNHPHPDSTISIAQSRDGGLTWMSRPHPGHLLDMSGTAALLKQYEFSADPMIRFGAAGVMFHVGLAATRDQTKSAIYSSTWIHLNNHEYDPEPVKFTGVLTEVATGTAAAFRDRPQLALGQPTGSMCSLDVPVYDPETETTITVSQTVPCTPAYVAFTTFSPDGYSEIRFTRSDDLGKTWSAPVPISGQWSTIAQGAQIVKIPKTRTILVFWRRGASPGQTDTIMYAVSFDNGTSWRTARVFAPICPFDQPTTPTTFRFKTMPNATAGPDRAFIVWAERTRTATGACEPLAGEARVMLSTMDGWSMTPPLVVAPSTQGHQIFPTVAVASGQVHVTWIDFRNDASRIFQPYVDEWSVVTGNIPPGGEQKRHTADIFAAEADARSLTFGPAFQVSEYMRGRVNAGDAELTQLQWNVSLARNFAKMRVPFHGDYNSSSREWIVPLDPVRLPGLWGLNLGDGWLPPRTPVFHDSWTDGRNVRLLPGGQYLTSCGLNGPPCELYGDNPLGSIPRPYTPPDLSAADPNLPAGGQSLYDPAQTRPPCDPNFPAASGTKNLDIYTSRTTRGLYAFAPWNNKSTGFRNYPELPLGKRWRLVQRAFPVVVENTSGVSRSFRLSIADTWWIGTLASFDQFDTGVRQVNVDIPARSMIARTVYVKSLFDRVPVRVDIRELDNGEPKPNGLRTTVFLNPDPTAPPNLLKPGQVDPSFDVAKYEVHGAEITGVDVQDINFQAVSGQGLGTAGGADPWSTPGWQNPGWQNPGWQNPGWQNPGWQNPGWQNPGWQNPGWQNPGWQNPGWQNPGWQNPGWQNQAVSDAEAQNGSSRYVTATVVSTGNTYSAYDAGVRVPGADPGLRYQLIVYKLYTTVATESCEHKLVGNTQVLANISNYDPVTASPSASFVLGPNETGYVVLVAFDPALRTFSDAKLPAQNVQVEVAPQAADSDEYIVWEAAGGTGEPPAPLPVPQPSLTIAPSTLPDGAVGSPYAEQQLSVSGGTEPFTWAVVSGSLPPGLSFSQGDDSALAFVGGTPTSEGTFSFTVRVTDSSSPVLANSRTYTIQVTNPLRIVTGGQDGIIADRFEAGSYVDVLTFVPPDLGYGQDFLFYYFRHSPAGASTMGTISAAGEVTDRFLVGTSFDALTFVGPSVGYGENLLYYLRHDATGFTTFGTISALAEAVVDRFGVGYNVDALTFAAPDLGYGPNLFYYIRHNPTTGLSTFGTISTSGAVVDRFDVGYKVDALTFAPRDLGYGPNLFYYFRHHPAAGWTTLGTISTTGAVVDRFDVGYNLDALTFVPPNVGDGANLFYYLRHDPPTGLTTFGYLADIWPPDAVQGMPYSQTPQATGGEAPLTWSLAAGSLPPGLSLAENTISGTPTASGIFTFTMQVADSGSPQQTATLLSELRVGTNPSGVGSAQPSSVAAGDPVPFHLIVHVTPGESPTSSGITVVVDASPIGGTSTLQLFDEGLYGGDGCDDIAGDNTFIACATVSGTTAPGTYVLLASFTDAEGRTGTTSITVNVIAAVPGIITGIVMDESGAVIPGAFVTATNTSTGATRTAVTNETGQYVMTSVPVGIYNVSAGAVTKYGILVTSGGTTVVNFP